jgi:hypothetical protein
MSVHPRRDRETDTAAISSMTSGTASTQRRVSRMIESDIETPQRWKRFDLTTLRVGMTDRTELARRICELWCVTTRAGRMRSFARQRRLRRVVLSAMAKQTRQPRVIFSVVFELRIAGLGHTKAQREQKYLQSPFVLFCGIHFVGFGL